MQSPLLVQHLLYLYSFSAVQHYIPVKYLHFLCNVFIFSFQMRMSFIQSQKSSYQYNNHFDKLRLIIIYLYIQATLFMFISLFFCLSLTILVVHHFVLCIFIFSFVSYVPCTLCISFAISLYLVYNDKKRKC